MSRENEYKIWEIENESKKWKEEMNTHSTRTKQHLNIQFIFKLSLTFMCNNINMDFVVVYYKEKRMRSYQKNGLWENVTIELLSCGCKS